MPGPRKQGLIVQARDACLLQELGITRVADREQIRCFAGFGSPRRANDRLLALTRSGLLRRFFIGTNAVGRKALYTLSPKGAKLVGSAYQGLRRAQDEYLVGDFFVNHQLGINEVYCTVKYRPIPVPGASFVRWLSFNEPVALGSALIPDGFFELRMSDATVFAFLEVDLGSETRSVWQAKVKGYLRYATSGQFAEQFADRPFRVLAIANSDRRTASLRAATATITEKIFWFTSFDAIERDGFWSAIWQRPTNERPQELLPTP
jgi:hypothetical protein